jgi:6-phosphogluconolactonase
MEMLEYRLQPIVVYIGTYTRRESFVDGKGEGIYVYAMHPASGALSYRSTVPGAVNPSLLAIARQRNCLYVVNEITGDYGGQHGTLSAYAIDPLTGDLAYLNAQSTHGLAPCYVSLDATAQYVLVANYESGSICVLPLENDGRLGEATDVVQHRGRGPHPRQAGPHAHMITPGPDGRTIFAVDLGMDKILAYHLDLERGKLGATDPPWLEMAPGTGPRHLAFHPNGRFAYVISELQSTVTVFGYDDGRGTLRERQTISTLPDGFVGDNLGAEICVAPSGRYVYASNRGHDSLAIYAVDAETGELALLGCQPSQGVGPRYFTIDPSGSFLLVANQDSDTVVTFRIDPGSGPLTATEQVTRVPTPVCLQLLQR